MNTKYFAILIIINVSLIFSDECDNIMVEYLKAYNPLNFSNPVVNSGTGYNDFGKYDLCLDSKFKYYLQKITFKNTKDEFFPTFDAYVGLCIPDVCYNETKFEGWRDFMVKYTGIKKENIEIIKSLEENEKYTKFDLISIIFLIFSFIFVIFSTGIVLLVIHFIKNDKKNQVEEIEGRESEKSQSRQIKQDEQFMNISGNINISVSSSSIERPSVSTQKEVPSFPEIEKTNCFIKLLENLFDFENNWMKMTRIPKEKNIKIIYGIKAVSMFIVIFSSMISFFSSYSIPIRNPEGLLEYVRSFIWQFFFNNSICYDILFFISAFYLSFRALSDVNVDNKSLKFYIKKIIHQFLKWYPIYIITFIFFWKIFPYLMTGPVSGYLFNNDIESCNSNYPFILSLVQNFTFNFFSFTNDNYNYNYHCFSYSWYIANLFHYYVIGTFLIYLYQKNWKIFYSIFSLLFFAVCGVELFVLINYKFGITFYEQMMENEGHYFELYYSKFYTRIPPYLIGLICGIWYYNSTKNETWITKLNSKTYIQIIVIISSYIILLASIFGMYFAYTRSHFQFVREIGLIGSVIYNFIVRKISIFVLFIAMTALLSGKFYYIGGFLSEDCFGYLNKSTIPAYLVHQMIIRFVLLNARYQLYFDGWYFLFYGTATLALSYVIGFFMYLLFGLPMHNLKKYLFDKNPSEEYDKLKYIEEKS